MKEPIWKGYILYDSNYMTFWKMQNYGDRKRSVVFRGQGRGRDELAEGFQSRETTLCDTIMVDAHHFTFVQAHRMYNTKSEPSCKLQTLGDNDVLT